MLQMSLVLITQSAVVKLEELLTISKPEVLNKNYYLAIYTLIQ